MKTGFVHSVKIPRSFKRSAQLVKEACVNKVGFKNLVFKEQHSIGGIYGLVSETLQHCSELNFILDKTKILIDNPRLDEWLARVLIARLLWQNKPLQSDCKPVQVILSYQDRLREALLQYSDSNVDPCKKNEVNIPRYVRINTILSTVSDMIKAFRSEGWNFLPRCQSYEEQLQIIKVMDDNQFMADFHIPNLLIFPPKTKFYNHPAYESGQIVLQDKASCIPAYLLDPKPSTEILDMCAAPGMKTTQLAALINNKGTIYAFERNTARYQTLYELVQNYGANCVKTFNSDSLAINPLDFEKVEYVLVDPSCTGSGMTQRIHTDEGEQSIGRLVSLQKLQMKILKFALQCFPQVKKVLYSTCSIYAEENEHVIQEVLKTLDGSYKLVNIQDKMKGWVNFSKDIPECLYARSQTDLCNGFFVALFERNFEKSVPHFKKNFYEGTYEMGNRKKNKRLKELDPNFFSSQEENEKEGKEQINIDDEYFEMNAPGKLKKDKKIDKKSKKSKDLDESAGTKINEVHENNQSTIKEEEEEGKDTIILYESIMLDKKEIANSSNCNIEDFQESMNVDVIESKKKRKSRGTNDDVAKSEENEVIVVEKNKKKKIA